MNKGGKIAIGIVLAIVIVAGIYFIIKDVKKATAASTTTATNNSILGQLESLLKKPVKANPPAPTPQQNPPAPNPLYPPPLQQPGTGYNSFYNPPPSGGGSNAATNAALATAGFGFLSTLADNIFGGSGGSDTTGTGSDLGTSSTDLSGTGDITNISPGAGAVDPTQAIDPYAGLGIDPTQGIDMGTGSGDLTGGIGSDYQIDPSVMI
jgi:hypothetical protein